MIPEIERLPPGWLIALTPTELQTVRDLKGDPARREYAEKRTKSREDTFELEDAWVFIHALGDSRRFVSGEQLHRGTTSQLVLLDVEALVAALTLPDKEAEFVRAFDQMNEVDFHRYVPLRVAWAWKAAGITTVKTPARRKQVLDKLSGALVFIDATTERAEHLLFFCDRCGPEAAEPQGDVREYQAIIWTEDPTRPGLRATVFATSLADARRQLEKEHGEGVAVTLRNLEDASTPR